MTTVTKQPIHDHVIVARRGDGVPFSDVVFRFRLTGSVIVKGDWTGEAALRLNGVTAHTFEVTLRDSTDNVDGAPANEIIGEDWIEVRLAPITAVESAAMLADRYDGTLALTHTGGQRQTLVDLTLHLSDNP